jgi:hypothetical protein
MLHALKTIQPYFSEVKSGKKNFELRKFDRPYKVGDDVVLQEWDNDKQEYTGEEVHFGIIYILKDVPKYGLKDGYCILGISQKLIAQHPTN